MQKAPHYDSGVFSNYKIKNESGENQNPRDFVSQENMTSALADVIETTLKPKGVAVYIDADHQCMSIRGVKKRNSSTVTTTFTGILKDDATAQMRFLTMIGDK